MAVICVREGRINGSVVAASRLSFVQLSPMLGLISRVGRLDGY